MASAIGAGIIAGMVLAVMIGPVFFALLQSSIEKGFLTGLMFALGVVSSDSVFFTLAYLGLSQIGGDNINFQGGIGSVGGLFLLIFGLGLILKKPKRIRQVPPAASKTSLLRNMMKGFLLNALNPAVMLYWITVVGSLHINFGDDSKSIFAFFVSCMIVVFSTDITKAFLAQKLKHIVTPRRMMWMNRVSGTVVVLFGLKLLLGAILRFLGYEPFI